VCISSSISVHAAYVTIPMTSSPVADVTPAPQPTSSQGIGLHTWHLTAPLLFACHNLLLWDNWTINSISSLF
jgi:hypothetical protein